MKQLDRRQFLGTIAKPAVVASVAMANPALMAKALAAIRGATGSPRNAARMISVSLRKLVPIPLPIIGPSGMH